MVKIFRKMLFYHVLIVMVIVILILTQDYNCIRQNMSMTPLITPNITVNYKDMNTGSMQKIDVEEYIIGVVAAEMPSSFEIEALKAQAVATRTYSIRNKNFVTNDVNVSQAYATMDELKRRWGKSFDEKYAKIKNAVDSTRGEVIKYNGEIISAVYHSTSAGKTQDAKDVWNTQEPYLKSVMSVEDQNSPSFGGVVRVAENDLKKKIQSKVKLKPKEKIDIKITERYSSEYVKTTVINKVSFSGPEIRRLFGLKSNDFDIKKEGKEYVFTTKGYGHGVGMSQYGAQFMAKAGKGYKDILKHYYTGVEIEKMY